MKSKVFFTIGLLPEILGNWHTRPALPVTLTPQSGESNDDILLQSSGNNDPIALQSSGSNDTISSGSVDQEHFCAA